MAFDIAGAALGFMSSLLDMQNVADTNSANRAIANETNANNASIARANREYDREVRATDWWHYLQTDQEAYRRFLENREYQSIGNQVNQYRDAGINPALALGSGALGHASSGSPPSSGNVPSGHGGETQPFYQSGAPMQPYQGFGLMAKNINDVILANNKQEADIAALRAQTQIQAIDTFSKVIQRGFENGKIKADMDKILQDFQFNQRNMVELDRQIKLANDKVYADQQYQEALTEGVRYANEIAPELHDLEKKKFANDFAVARATISELQSRVDLNDQQKELVGKHIVEQELINKDLPKKLHNDNTILVQTYKRIKADVRRLEFAGDTEFWNSMDARKRYRSNIGSERPLDEYVEEALRNSTRVRKLK